jgi:hypothetical protein
VHNNTQTSFTNEACVFSESAGSEAGGDQGCFFDKCGNLIIFLSKYNEYFGCEGKVKVVKNINSKVQLPLPFQKKLK